MICVKLLLAVSAVDKSNVILVWQEAQPVLQDCPGGWGGGEGEARPSRAGSMGTAERT